MKYEEFMKQYSSSIKDHITESEYNNLRMYVSNEVFNCVERNNFKIDDNDLLTDFIVNQLLKRQSYNEIISGISEVRIEYIVEQIYRKSIEPASKEKNMTTPLKVIKKFIYSIEDIFAPDFDLDTLSNNLYDLLIYYKYTDADIMNGNANDDLILSIFEKVGNISFTPEFEKFLEEVKKETSGIFASNILEIRRSEKDSSRLQYNVAYNCYNNAQFKKVTTFNAALTYYLASDKLNEPDHNKLYDFIRRTVDKEVIRYNSIQRKDSINEIRTVFKVKEKSVEKKEHNETTKKVIAFIVALFIIENLIHVIVKNCKEDEEKTNKPKIEYNYNNTSSAIDRIGKSYYGFTFDPNSNEMIVEDDSSVKL